MMVMINFPFLYKIVHRTQLFVVVPRRSDVASTSRGSTHSRPVIDHSETYFLSQIMWKLFPQQFHVPLSLFLLFDYFTHSQNILIYYAVCVVSNVMYIIHGFCIINFTTNDIVKSKVSVTQSKHIYRLSLLRHVKYKPNKQ